jgi:hypothetical protein
VFNLLGQTAHREALDVFSAWDTMPRPCSRGDVESWVRRYFAFLDVHGAFIFSPGSTPGDDEVHRAVVRMTMRACFLLGVALRARQRTPTEAPESLGLVVQATLDRSWYQARITGLPVDLDDVVATVTSIIVSLLEL